MGVITKIKTPFKKRNLYKLPDTIQCFDKFFQTALGLLNKFKIMCLNILLRAGLYPNYSSKMPKRLRKNVFSLNPLFVRI